MGRRTVRPTDPALDGLNEARQWLHQYGAGATASARNRVRARAIRNFGTDPMRHRHSAGNPDLRIASIARDRIIYAVTPNTGDNRTAGDVTVLAVLGPGES